MQYDLIIIGSGPAGIATVEYFINSNKKVLIVESGDKDKVSNYEYKKSISSGEFKINFRDERKKAFFGTSALWKTPGVGGTFWEFDLIDFEYSGFLKWGIKYDEIKKAYKEAWKYLNIKNKFSNLKLNIKNKLWRALSENYSIKLASSHFTFGRNYEKFILKKGGEILNSKNITILFNTNLNEIILNKSKNKIEKITTLDNKGIERSFFAQEIVLSCGCFENNIILLNLFYKNNLNCPSVGKFVTFHPSINIGNLKLGKNNDFSKRDLEELNKVFILKNKKENRQNKLNYGMTIIPKVQETNITKTIIKKIKAIKKSFFEKTIRIFVSNLFNLFFSFDILKYLIYKIKIFKNPIQEIDFAISFEHLPSINNQIKINKKSNFFVINSYLNKKNKDFLKEVILNNQSNLKNIFPKFKANRIDFNVLNLETGNHHHGGTIIGDENKGVVNQNLKVNKISNLYIAGSSIFPNSSIYNPTLTIIAMSLRLSKYLYRKIH